MRLVQKTLYRINFLLSFSSSSYSLRKFLNSKLHLKNEEDELPIIIIPPSVTSNFLPLSLSVPPAVNCHSIGTCAKESWPKKRKTAKKKIKDVLTPWNRNSPIAAENILNGFKSWFLSIIILILFYLNSYTKLIFIVSH